MSEVQLRNLRRAKRSPKVGFREPGMPIFAGEFDVMRRVRALGLALVITLTVSGCGTRNAYKDSDKTDLDIKNGSAELLCGENVLDQTRACQIRVLGKPLRLDDFWHMGRSLTPAVVVDITFEGNNLQKFAYLACKESELSPASGGIRVEGYETIMQHSKGSILSIIDKTLDIDKMTAKEASFAYRVSCSGIEMSDVVNNAEINMQKLVEKASEFLRAKDKNDITNDISVVENKNINDNSAAFDFSNKDELIFRNAPDQLNEQESNIICTHMGPRTGPLMLAQSIHNFFVSKHHRNPMTLSELAQDYPIGKRVRKSFSYSDLIKYHNTSIDIEANYAINDPLAILSFMHAGVALKPHGVMELKFFAQKTDTCMQKCMGTEYLGCERERDLGDVLVFTITTIGNNLE